MTKSYHDLQTDTEDKVLTHQLTKIHGRPYWMQLQKMIKELCKIACIFKVSYEWSGNYGLMAMILGAVKYGLRHPTLPAHVQPTQPAARPNIPNGNASDEFVRNARDDHNEQIRDWAAVCGFVS